MRTLIVAMLVFAVCTPMASARTWTDSSGKHTVEAEFVDLKDGKARLRKGDGKTITIPVERLSEGDQEFVKTRGEAKKTGAATRATEKRKTPSGPDSQHKLEVTVINTTTQPVSLMVDDTRHMLKPGARQVLKLAEKEDDLHVVGIHWGTDPRGGQGHIFLRRAFPASTWSITAKRFGAGQELPDIVLQRPAVFPEGEAMKLVGVWLAIGNVAGVRFDFRDDGTVVAGTREHPGNKWVDLPAGTWVYEKGKLSMYDCGDFAVQGESIKWQAHDVIKVGEATLKRTR